MKLNWKTKVSHQITAIKTKLTLTSRTAKASVNILCRKRFNAILSAKFRQDEGLHCPFVVDESVRIQT